MNNKALVFLLFLPLNLKEGFFNYKLHTCWAISIIISSFATLLFGLESWHLGVLDHIKFASFVSIERKSETTGNCIASPVVHWPKLHIVSVQDMLLKQTVYLFMYNSHLSMTPLYLLLPFVMLPSFISVYSFCGTNILVAALNGGSVE